MPAASHGHSRHHAIAPQNARFVAKWSKTSLKRDSGRARRSTYRHAAITAAQARARAPNSASEYETRTNSPGVPPTPNQPARAVSDAASTNGEANAYATAAWTTASNS